MGGKRRTRKDRNRKRKRNRSNKKMTVEEILDDLRYYGDGKFPRTALKNAIARREEITPDLLEILEDAAQNIEDLPRGYMAHLYAMFLLAQFREERAYPLIVDFFSTPGEVVMDVTGDVVTEYLGRILASVSGGDPGLMKTLVENEEANEYVRSAAFRGLTSLVIQGELPREEMMVYLQHLFRGGIIREHSVLWNTLVSDSVRLYPEEVYEDIKQAYKDGLVETFFVGFEDVERALARGKEQTLEELQDFSHHYDLVEDVISEMEWWAGFSGSR